MEMKTLQRRKYMYTVKTWAKQQRLPQKDMQQVLL